jgi:hypothetical protein
MYFSKYVLLNFPKQNLNPGTMSNPVQWDFENTFIKANQAVAANYADQLVESLRNYVANHEVTIRESRLNNTEFFYDNNQLENEKDIIHKLNQMIICIAIMAKQFDSTFFDLDNMSKDIVKDAKYFINDRLDIR